MGRFISLLNRQTEKNGFTLIELIITIAIIGILAVLAYPSFERYIIKGKRVSAQTHLVDIAQRQQQYLLDARSYATTVAALSMTTPTDVSSYYDIAIGIITGPPIGFNISAQPKAGTSQAADKCKTLNINNTGDKTTLVAPGGVSTGVKNCW